MSLKNSLRTDFTVRYFFKEITRFYKFSRHAPAKFNLFISALAKKVPAFVSCMYVYTTALDISGSCTYYPTRQIATTTQVSIVYRASITLLPKITRISARFLAIKKKEKKKEKEKKYSTLLHKTGTYPCSKHSILNSRSYQAALRVAHVYVTRAASTRTPLAL